MSADEEACLTSTAAAAEEPATAAASEESDNDGEPTATDGVAPPFGDAAASAEAPALAPVEGGASGSGGPAPGAPEFVGHKGKNILREIQELKEQQKKARDDKKKISKELRNAEKRRQRLKKGRSS